MAFLTYAFAASCRVPDDQMSYRRYPLLAAKELLQQFIREQGYGHQATLTGDHHTEDPGRDPGSV